MNVNEKFEVILVSVFLSFLLNILLSRLTSWIDERSRKKRFKDNMLLLFSKLPAAIISNSILTSDIDTIINQLLLDYSLITSNKKLLEDFRIIYGFCTFLKNGGYETLPQRKDNDLSIIDKIYDKYK
jgi:hypothetical protein